jgi:hypothetical protein
MTILTKKPSGNTINHSDNASPSNFPFLLTVIHIAAIVEINRSNISGEIMRFLDVDLDFFLNKNAYFSGSDEIRLDSKYKPWSNIKVKHFLEERCKLSHDTPTPGRTISTHNDVIDFWRTLIESGDLKIPFDVIHVDAHPDLAVRGGMYQKSGFLHFESESAPELLERETLHSGNYLTFALAFGWIASLVWIPLSQTLKNLSKGYDDVKYQPMHQKKSEGGDSSERDLSTLVNNSGVPYRIIPWYQFRIRETFDYMVLSTSPGFTPLESDELIPVIEWYMKKI